MSQQNSSDIFNHYKCCVIIPTYNNGHTLASVINGCKKYCNDIWVINDGSTDETREILENIVGIRVLHQTVNRGKGVALRRAFQEAGDSGFKYAVTIDSDGQHEPADLVTFANALDNDPGTMFIGARNMGQQSIPGKSKFGHKNSNFWFWVETGLKAEDTQSGYRLYPLTPTNKLLLLTWKYEFEIEVIVRLAWMGIQIKFIPVHVYYPENRVTHFRPFKDFTRVAILNAFLVVAAFLYFRPLMIIRNLRKRSWKQVWREYILKPNEPTWKKSFAVGAGVFSGIVPLWGFQTALAAIMSVVFKLNKPLTILSSQISVPPMIPLVIYASIGMGSLLINRKWDVKLPEQFSTDLIYQDFTKYLVGAITLAIIAGLFATAMTWILIILFRKNKP
jgi:glycosyltransferase involved in cell wall biosynthesis